MSSLKAGEKASRHLGDIYFGECSRHFPKHKSKSKNKNKGKPSKYHIRVHKKDLTTMVKVHAATTKLPVGVVPFGKGEKEINSMRNLQVKKLEKFKKKQEKKHIRLRECQKPWLFSA